MSDQSGGTGPKSGDQWGEVLKGLDQFGDAVSRWVRASVNDPKNRERAQELKSHLTVVTDKVSDAVQDVTATDAGQSVRDAAGHAGEAVKTAGSKFTSEVAPSLADMFRSAAAGLSEAASRMETRASEASADVEASAESSAGGSATTTGSEGAPDAGSAETD